MSQISPAHADVLGDYGSLSNCESGQYVHELSVCWRVDIAVCFLFSFFFLISVCCGKYRQKKGGGVNAALDSCGEEKEVLQRAAQ